MAANFWTSSHLSWLVPKERLQRAHAADRAKGLTERDVQQIKAYFAQYLVELGFCVRARQRVVATAVVYFRRFYLVNNFCDHDPGVIAAGSLYLAGKVEEAVIGAKQLLHQLRQIPASSQWPCDLKQLLDAEMLLIEQLDAHLVVFSPYLALSELLQSDARLADLSENAWAALNDSYRTDLALVYPPYMLAIGAIFLASVICSRDADVAGWLAKLAVDINQVYDIIMELMHMYDHYRKNISPSHCRALLSIVRPPAAAAAAAAGLPGAVGMQGQPAGEAAGAAAAAVAQQGLVGGVAAAGAAGP